jgi:hypothetical protein
MTKIINIIYNYINSFHNYINIDPHFIDKDSIKIILDNKINSSIFKCSEYDSPIQNRKVNGPIIPIFEDSSHKRENYENGLKFVNLKRLSIENNRI